jgi:excisionase family DNA binding protein
MQTIIMKRYITTEYSDSEFKELINSTVNEALQQELSKVIPQFFNNSPPNFFRDKFLNRKEVCELLRISLPTLAKIQSKGKLQATMVGGSYRYSKKHIEEYINSGKRK